MSTFCAKIGEFSYFLWNSSKSPLFELIPQIPILKNLSLLLGQKSHKTGKFPPFGHTASEKISDWIELESISKRAKKYYLVCIILFTSIYVSIKIVQKLLQKIPLKKYLFFGIFFFIRNWNLIILHKFELP